MEVSIKIRYNNVIRYASPAWGGAPQGQKGSADNGQRFERTFAITNRPLSPACDRTAPLDRGANKVR